MGTNAVSKRRHKVKGLHLSFKGVGDSITIEHLGETLEIIYQGNNGANSIAVSFVGSKSFHINPKNNEEKSKPAL